MVTNAPHIVSLDFDCPVCTKFLIGHRALNFIEENSALVADRLPLLSRAARRARGRLVITDEWDVVKFAVEQEASEANLAPKEK